LIRGRIEWLKLAPDGDREADSKFRVEATQPNKRYYARAILSLRAHWNAKPFAYDWRRDIDTASDALATFIRESFPGEPVHIVAHSMGGLVARNMIRRHPQLWTSMQDGDRSRGGRLIMLGTPNYGSFAIVQALTGEDRMMGVLEKCDLAHDMRELLAITNTFLGSYQLLPAPQKLPAPLASLYQADTWPSFAGVSQNHLNRAYAFHTDLDAATASIDGDRMPPPDDRRHDRRRSRRLRVSALVRGRRARAPRARPPAWRAQLLCRRGARGPRPQRTGADGARPAARVRHEQSGDEPVAACGTRAAEHARLSVGDRAFAAR
jgi:pimeloyl-ACP methyl ester carboxylesterase